MRKLFAGLAGLALLAGACTTVSQNDAEVEASPPETAPASTTTVAAEPVTTTTEAPTTTTTTIPPTTTTIATTTTAAPPPPAPAQTTTTPQPEGEPVLTEPAAAPDSFSASVVGGAPILIPNNAQDVTISVDVVFNPGGYCESFFIIVTCGWDFHESPTWPGNTFTPENDSVFTATETLTFAPSEGDSKIFYFTYGYGEFLGFGDTGTQTLAVLVQRASA